MVPASGRWWQRAQRMMRSVMPPLRLIYRAAMCASATRSSSARAARCPCTGASLRCRPHGKERDSAMRAPARQARLPLFRYANDVHADASRNRREQREAR